MKAEYKNKLPKWYNDNKQYDLILTDDIDSLMSCAILKFLKNWSIENVMLFKADTNKSIDYLGKTSDATNETVGVDFALQNGKCFDNHVSRISKLDPINSECVNLNVIRDITRENYFKKYNLSTVLLLWSLFDLPIPESEEGKMILLTIDSSYYSYFSKKQYQDMNRYYMCDIMGLDELYECQGRHTQAEFKEIEKKFKLKEKIVAKNGYLDTNIDLLAINNEIGWDTGVWCSLPKKKFTLHKKFYDKQVSINNNTTLSEITKNPYSVALTGRDFICYSEEIKE